jgi:hypothetical protein
MQLFSFNLVGCRLSPVICIVPGILKAEGRNLKNFPLYDLGININVNVLFNITVSADTLVTS